MQHESSYHGGSSCILKVSKFPDDPTALLEAVKSLPGIDGKPVNGKYFNINLKLLKLSNMKLYNHCRLLLWRTSTTVHQPPMVYGGLLNKYLMTKSYAFSSSNSGNNKSRLETLTHFDI